jgi:hypothetical protein
MERVKIIRLEIIMFEVSSNIYFIVYDLYYVGQNNDLGTRARPIHWDGGSINNLYYRTLIIKDETHS